MPEDKTALDQQAVEIVAAELAYAVGFEDRRELCRLDAERILAALSEAGYSVVKADTDNEHRHVASHMSRTEDGTDG